MERIKEILDKYTSEDAKLFENTVEMLCKNGVARGTYQDYSMLMDIIGILSICEHIVKGEGK